MITVEAFKDFRRGVVWPYLRGYIEERIEHHRELLETPPETRSTREADDSLRGRNAELRIFLNAIEDDGLLLQEIEDLYKKE